LFGVFGNNTTKSFDSNPNEVGVPWNESQSIGCFRKTSHIYQAAPSTPLSQLDPLED
jgi:hypothetical protein